MANYYSKRMKLLDKEEKKMLRRTIFAFAGIAILGAALFIGGIPAILSIGSFLNGSKSGNVDAVTQTGPLIAPRLEPLDTATNSAKMSVSGFSQEGSNVELFVNSQSVGSQLVGKNGEFTFADIMLQEGKNGVYAVTKTDKGEQSSPSTTYEITYDKTAPKVEIASPSDKQTFSGKEREVKVSGKTDPDATVFVNDSIATMNGEGEFSAFIVLQPGEQTLKISVTDAAGNKTNVDRVVTYNP